MPQNCVICELAFWLYTVLEPGNHEEQIPQDFEVSHLFQCMRVTGHKRKAGDKQSNKVVIGITPQKTP